MIIQVHKWNQDKENMGLSLDGAETIIQKEKAKVHKASLALALTGKTSIQES